MNTMMARSHLPWFLYVLLHHPILKQKLQLYRNGPILVKHGIVSIRDSKIISCIDSNGSNIGPSSGTIVRLELSGDTLKIQKEIECVDKNLGSHDDVIIPKERTVILNRQKLGGLGLSIKGGFENKLPVLISRIFKDQAADQTGQLYVGDAILRVNNTILDQCNHDDAVNILRAAGDEVTLVVKHYRNATPFLNKNFIKTKDRPSSSEEISLNNHCDEDGWQSPRSNKETNQLFKDSSSTSHDKKWTDMIALNLILACITRYIPGTDKRRPNAFEVHCADGMSSGIIQCEDGIVLTDWVKHVSNNITQLTGQQIFKWNKELESHNHILPDWSHCSHTFKVHQAMFRTLKATEHVDDRHNCFLLQTGLTSSMYFSAKTRADLMRIESAWHKATYASITRLGVRPHNIF
ncbi:Gamma-1-syntrophin [Nymphon striatum]|nr:Gamma-1-syntrophin [Nymphon striatum]